MFLRRKNSSSERPRPGGILIRSEFCIKLVFSRHTRKYVGKKCTRMYTSGQAIFKKANGERLFRTDTDVREIEQQRVCSANSTLNSVHGSTLFNSATDVGGSIQKRVCLQTRSPQMYTDVHSWAGMSVVLYSIEFFVYEKLEVQKCTRTDISERWHPCSPLLMILSFLVTSVIVRIKEKRYA